MAASLTTVSSPLAQASAKASTGNTKKVLTQEDFLNLFVTQMRFQNPLEPMDNYQMASQMGQMTSVETLKSIGEAIGKMAAGQEAWSQFQSASLLGKKVEYEGKAFTLEEGTASEIYYQPAAPGKALFEVFDAGGRRVWKSEAALADTGKQRFAWDGRNLQGAQLPDGEYFLQVTAADAGGNPVSVATRGVGTVTGLSLENGASFLQVGKNRISLNEVTAILA
jgi:flagellar basal-body rod modification protein FlgD